MVRDRGLNLEVQQGIKAIKPGKSNHHPAMSTTILWCLRNSELNVRHLASMRRSRAERASSSKVKTLMSTAIGLDG